MAVKKTKTVAQKHAEEIDAINARHDARIETLIEQHQREIETLEKRIRHERKGAFWQGGFFVGAPATIVGLVIGACIVFAATVSTLPVAFELVVKSAVFSQGQDLVAVTPPTEGVTP